MTGLSPLYDVIRRRIAQTGPITVADYMALCLDDPQHGYYATRDPFGAAGDFVTAPEISQMFGELIGLWAATVWRMIGAPPAFNLVELGPGRGTMMADALRAARIVPGFREAAAVRLVETSPVLRARQRRTLEAFGSIAWHDSLDSVPDGPSIILANEFFDALPVHQAVRERDGWHERTVEVGDNGMLRFGSAAALLDTNVIPLPFRDAPAGAIFEWRAPDMAARLARSAAALVIDYGHVRSGLGDTLQALRARRYDHPLAAPGEADLTAHVDFAALAAAAAAAGAHAHGPVEQAVFLRRLGIAERAAALKATANAEQAAAVDAALDRLTERSSTGMGALFKALGLSRPGLDPLPGFDA